MGTAAGATAPFGLNALGQIGITVRDAEKAAAFYRDALGLKLLFQMPGMAFFDCGGIRLMLSVSEKSAETYSSVLYFKVEEIAAAWAALAERGVTLEREPHLIARMPDHELWMAFFRDADGNLLALMSEVRPAA
jgi:methylmalonyl-CoA/ethylmalonyl-CoA epimerase